MQSSQTSDLFIGRKKERELFEQWLTDDNSPVQVLYFHDKAEEPEKKGGIGKTWLLKECIRWAEQ